MSAWAEEGEVLPFQDSVSPGSHTGQGLPPELPAFLLGPQPSAQDAQAEIGMARGWPDSFLA